MSPRAEDLRSFDRDDHWFSAAGAKHLELLEHSPERHAWQFDTDSPPLAFLRAISRQWHSLTFLLDYDSEVERLKHEFKVLRVRECLPEPAMIDTPQRAVEY